MARARSPQGAEIGDGARYVGGGNDRDCGTGRGRVALQAGGEVIEQRVELGIGESSVAVDERPPLSALAGVAGDEVRHGLERG